MLFTTIRQCQTNSSEQATINFHPFVNLIASYDKDGVLGNYSNQQIQGDLHQLWFICNNISFQTLNLSLCSSLFFIF